MTSVIVPVRAGGPAFDRCLGSIRRADPPPDEVVVVADGALPEDVETATIHGARVVAHHPARGPSFARNRGAELAKGSVFMFVDADCEVAPDTFGRVAAVMNSPDAPDAVIGSYDDAPAEPDVISQFRNLLHHYTHQHGREDAHTFWGACGVVRREAFEAVGGFSESYAVPCIEDIELGYRLRERGYRIRLERRLQVKHLKRWRPGMLLRTDTARRAYPWALLLLDRGGMPDDLNTRRESIWSVFFACTLVPGLALAGVWLPALALVLVAATALAVLNREFYRFLVRKRGAVFLCRAAPWHLVYFMTAGAGFAAAWIAHTCLASARRTVDSRLETAT